MRGPDPGVQGSVDLWQSRGSSALKIVGNDGAVEGAPFFGHALLQEADDSAATLLGHLQSVHASRCMFLSKAQEVHQPLADISGPRELSGNVGVARIACGCLPGIPMLEGAWQDNIPNIYTKAEQTALETQSMQANTGPYRPPPRGLHVLE